MALPSHNNTRYTPSALGPAYGRITRYIIRSPDILDLQPDDNNETIRVAQVQEEESGRVIWSQERVLTADEIIDSLYPVVPAPTPSSLGPGNRNTETSSRRMSYGPRALWTTHRPKKGWYIRLKSPSLPPTVFIPLLPYTPDGRGNTVAMKTVSEGAFTFACRTRVDMGRMPPSAAGPSPLRRRVHSYPPPPSPDVPGSPFTGAAQPPERPGIRSPGSTRDSVSSAASSKTTGHSISSSGSAASTFVDVPVDGPSTGALPRPAEPRTQITQFVISPEPNMPPPPHHRAPAVFSAIRNVLSLAARRSFTVQPPSLPPILAFHDTSPLIGFRATAVIELDEGIAMVLGIEKSFYIAAALAFWEFLGDKEGYQAASDG